MEEKMELWLFFRKGARKTGRYTNTTTHTHVETTKKQGEQKQEAAAQQGGSPHFHKQVCSLCPDHKAIPLTYTNAGPSNETIRYSCEYSTC